MNWKDLRKNLTVCKQFLDNENNGENNRAASGHRLCLRVVWGYTEIFPIFLIPFAFLKVVGSIRWSILKLDP